MGNKKGNLNCELLHTFSHNVLYYRKEAGMTQIELGINSGYAHSFINDIENAKKGASLETIENIASALNIEPFFLLINPKDRFTSDNPKLVGYLTTAQKMLDNFFEKPIKDISQPKKK